ncbi:hypothetical protein RB195_024533 [Necator americanus]|uniref:RabBD domain-containing protein n=1 Tax=Necator americanus TaxID=51031 RepID=A0ABR1ENK8_NECAM
MSLLETRLLIIRDRTRRELWNTSAHAPTKIAEDNSKNALCDELNAPMFKIPNQHVVIVGVDANAKMGLERRSVVITAVDSVVSDINDGPISDAANGTQRSLDKAELARSNKYRTMDDSSLMPDLSHLSAEEREIIEQVFKRQKDEEAKEVQLTL